MNMGRLIIRFLLLVLAFYYAFEDAANIRPEQPKWLSRYLSICCVVNAVFWA